ncbi:MAG: NAD-binding protein [Acidobacteriota bacterium]
MALQRARQRILLLLSALPVLLVGTAWIYMFLMDRFEADRQGFWDAFEFVAETITTTGYGHQASWDHPVSILFVVVLQFFGVFLVYMLVPFLLLPLLEDRFEMRLPREAPDLEDHVVIFRFGPAVETLLEELVMADVPLVIVELDDDEVRALVERTAGDAKRYRGVYPVHERSIAKAFEGARLETARALILNGNDEENTAAALIAGEFGFTRDIFALVEEPHHRRALSMAGATSVVTPRHVLGAAIAARASHRIQPRVDGIQQLGKRLRVAEVRIDPESELAGKTLRDADLGGRTGATVIGQWVHGELQTRPRADMRLEPRGMLVVIGSSKAVDALSELAGGGRVGLRRGPFIIAGYGEVGQKVAQLLRDVGEEVVIVDQSADIKGVELVGDIADPEIFERLELDQARALILALDNDSATLFATLILRGESNDLPVIARVNLAENIDRLHRSGADFAISIAQVAAQILAQRLLRRDTLSLGTDLQVLRASAETLVKSHPSVQKIRRKTGCSVVAVERDNELRTEIGADFEFEAGDVIYVCGHREDTERFIDRYGGRLPPRAAS